MGTANPETVGIIVDALNEYAFLHIWNEIRAEYRVNIRLQAVSDRFTTGYIMGGGAIPLPTPKDQYAVFKTATTFFDGGLAIPNDQWIDSVTAINKYGIMLHTYPDHGRMVPKGGVFVRKSSSKNRVYIAIVKEALLKVSTLGTYKEIYLTLYRDSDQANPITCQTFHLPVGSSMAMAARVEAAIRDSQQQSPHGTMVFINGYEIDPTKGIPYVFGDYVDVITDRNVVGSFTVNLTQIDTGFYSKLDTCYKEVIHCPKDLNPTNKLVTHNTVTMFVRDNRQNLGTYLHRCDDVSVGQITHNDLSVATHVINAHRDYLHTQDVSIHVKVRTHSKDNVLMRDSHYIDYLYLCDDDVILQHLRGKVDANLSFWSAAELEQSIYVSMMFDTPNIITADVLDQYINGLGYHTVTSILCQHMQSQTLAADRIGNLMYTKPIIYRGMKTEVEAFINGHKVNHTQVLLKDFGGDRISVSFDDSVYTTTGQTVTVNMLEAGDARPRLFTPKPGSTYITVPFKGARVFERLSLGTDVTKGWTGHSGYAYKELFPKAGTLMIYPSADGTTQVVCGQSLYNKTLVVVNARYYHAANYDLSSAYTDKAPLIVNLQITAEDDDNTLVPLLGYTSLDLYLNGMYLIRGIDYTDVPVTDRDGNPSIVEVYVTNKEYLSETQANRLEVVAQTSVAMCDESGYVIHDKVSYDTDINTWYSGVSQLYVGGRLIIDAEDKGTYMQLHGEATNGTPFYLTTTIPEGMGTVLQGYSPETDLDRIRKINAYFREEDQIDPGLVIIPNSHKVYSPYLMGIIYDINRGVYSPVAEPDNSAFLAQFFPYLYLKQRDPCMAPQVSGIDIRYVDRHPAYTEVDVPDPTTYKLVKRLTKLVLSEDKYTAGDLTDG